jgi:carotenoid cleavage dioxygenase-like enzyme
MKRRQFLIQSSLAAMAAVTYHQLPSHSTPLDNHYKSYKSWKSDNIFLKGINAPVFKEVELNNLKISGTIPSQLQGMYLRNGPNPMFKPESYSYPIEGDGMLHGMFFKNGKVSYKNRWIQTRGLAYEMLEGKQLSELKFKNYANTNIIAHSGKLLALYETGLPYQITENLETIGEWDFNKQLTHSMTAHPKIDPSTGELHFYRYSFFNTPYLHYYIADSQGKIIRESPIEISQPTMIHDMVMTKNYIVFFNCPLVFSMVNAKNNKIPFTWQPEEGTTIILVDRHNPDKKPIYLKTDAFWTWHFMNGFEADDQLFIDFVSYPKIQSENNWETMLTHTSHLQRLGIDLKTQKMDFESLDDRYVELPVVNSHHVGQAYQFGYTSYYDTELSSRKKIPNLSPSLVQYDVINKTNKIHQFKPGCYGGEAAFIPNPNKQSELDGYVVTFVYNENTNTSDFIIIDPRNFESEPIATIHLPVRVPGGFHGNWIAQTS